MAGALGRLALAIKAARELGPARSFWYGVYQLGLRSGHYRRVTPVGQYPAPDLEIHSPFALPDAARLRELLGARLGEVMAEADEITAGQVRLFGGPPVTLNLTPRTGSRHWSEPERRGEGEDIKLTWEPARFGWAYRLGRAYHLSGDERYARAFWQHFETFLAANPPNQGPNWESAQEVGLRLMALLFAARVFGASGESTAERRRMLAGAVAAHAKRIPPTLPYALAQNNNHLVSEALGLYLAGVSLPGHTQANQWRAAGWSWLNRALQAQILPDGTYAQHSMNYHRLMLHAALQAGLAGQDFPRATREALAAAMRWLIAQVDPVSGRAPNLGSNDGALILPLSTGGQADYRCTAQAAARAFLGQPALPPGAWDELGMWLGQAVDSGEPLPGQIHSPGVHRLGAGREWGTLRAVRFEGRPSHADQLHVELWWRGENIAQDAGTFRYTAKDPWDNALAGTRVHNTVMVNEQDQMLRAGRFLWLDWAQARMMETGAEDRTSASAGERLAAEQDGYRRLNVLHRRTLHRQGAGHWTVTDQMLAASARRGAAKRGEANRLYTLRLHWLLPDWPWELKGNTLTLAFPSGGRVSLTLSASVEGKISLVRAGEGLAGDAPAAPILGWYSPTYNTRQPALSFSLMVRAGLPCELTSKWVLEEEPTA